MSCVFHDSSEERQAWKDSEEERERLRRSVVEAHHRVSNNLSLLAAMVDLQASSDEEPLSAGAARRLSIHVRALSQIHRLLTRGAQTSPADGMEAQETLGTLVPFLQATVMPRLVTFTEGEAIHLPAKAATALALITNEAVANALKYSTGSVDVSLAMRGSEGVLEITDEGKGFDTGFDVQRDANTGLQLIEQLARHDLNGRVEYDNKADGGGRVRVMFPIPA